jgi:hypothetical protein
MRLVTVATHSERFMPWLTESCKRFATPLTVLGWGETWQGFGHKLQLVQTFLQSLDAQEVVCFIDAYDVILLRELASFEQLFMQMHHVSGTELWIGTITFLMPQIMQWLCRAGSRYYFGQLWGHNINSGVYVGFAGSLARLLANGKAHGNTDDQVLFTHQLQCINAPKTFIDTSSLLALNCMTAPWTNITKIPGLHIRDQALIYFGIQPFFLHGPGSLDLSPLLLLLGYEVSISDQKHFRHLHWQFTWQRQWTFFYQDFDNRSVQVIIVLVVILLLMSTPSTMNRL